MSSKAPCDRHAIPSSDTIGNIVNAGIDSTFSNDPSNRGSLSQSELDAIHQTNSFKQAKKLEEKDSRELANKMKHSNDSNNKKK